MPLTPAPEHPEPSTAWHRLPPEKALRLTGSDVRRGLSWAIVEEHRKRHGPNRLPPPPKRSAWLRFLLQFHDVLIYVLIGAGLVTLALGDFTDAAVIFGVVVINALIGFIQEGRAEAALDAIRGMLSLSATVRRDGQRITIPAEDLVPGDLVWLQSGDRVPADLRLLEVRNLRIDEAALTGESEAVEKSVAPVAGEAALGDRICMAYSGTLVTYGQGLGLVVATGAATEIGRINALLTEVEALATPLQRKLQQFGRWLTGAIVLLAAATLGFGVLARGYALKDMFMAVVGLAVAAIPEGLPAIVTITLAVGVQRMAKRNAIVRRLPAVETLGSVTVICTDKTGTLTRNEMTVRSAAISRQRFAVSGAGYDPRGGFAVDGQDAALSDWPELSELARAALLCNDAVLRGEDGGYRLEGDPTEGALLTFAYKAGLDPALTRGEFPRLDAIPFESEHRFMATLHADRAGHTWIFLKGAPEAVLDRCLQQRVDGEDRPLDGAHWRQVEDELAAQGQRLLALAVKPLPQPLERLDFGDVSGGFSLLGLLGLIDAPREEAIRAVEDCHRAGIRVKMITGDHAVTARAIGVQLRIGDGRSVLTGAEIGERDEASLRREASEVDVFARASPEHKLRLVRALQADRQIVAMTGDGVNDAPALKQANVGVAMGLKGTEAAKESAAIVLADDNFATIAHAVEEGRTIYDNLTKAVVYILPTSFGEAGAIIIAILLGLTLPITPVQILWVNMVTAVTLSLTLAFEPAEADIMQRPPRDPAQPLLTPYLLWRIAFVAGLLTFGILWLFEWEIQLGASIDAARSAAVNALVIGEMVYLFNSRFMRASAFSLAGLTGNRYALLASAILLLVQFAFTYASPMQHLFATAAIPGEAWLRILGFGGLVFTLVELEKWLLRRGPRARAARPATGSIRFAAVVAALLLLGQATWVSRELAGLSAAPGLDAGLLLAAASIGIAAVIGCGLLVSRRGLSMDRIALDTLIAAALLAVSECALRLELARLDPPYLLGGTVALLALGVAYLALRLAISIAAPSRSSGKPD